MDSKPTSEELGSRINELEKIVTESKKNEVRFRSIYHQSPIGIGLFDSDGKVQDVNKTCLDIFGISEVEEVKGLDLFEDPNVTDDLKERLLNGETVRCEIDFDFSKVKKFNLYKTTKSGILHLDVVFVPQSFRAGRSAAGYLAFVQDNTERVQVQHALKRAYEELERRAEERTSELKRANEELHQEIDQRKQIEKELRQSEEQFRLLFETMASGFSLLEMIYNENGKPIDCRYVRVNPSHQRHSGLNPSEIIGKTAKGLFGLKDEWIEIYGRVDKTGNPVMIEDYAEGLGRWFQVTAYRPKPGFVAVTFDNITERKQAEEKLRETKQLLSNAIDNAPIGMLLVRLDGYFHQVNQAFCEMTGYSAQELLNMTFQDITSPDDLSIGSEIVKKLIARESDKGSAEKRYIHKNGNVIHVHLNTSLLRDDTGKPLYFSTQIQDITARKRAEEEKAKLETQLRNTNKIAAIGTLTGGIAHDFNNILGIIIGNMELAMDDIPEWSPARLNLEEIKTAGLRAKDVVLQLLSFSHKTEQRKNPLKINTIIEETINLLRASIPTTIDIRSNIPNDVGTIQADPTQIHQILINLCTNATHAMEEDGGTLEVGITEVEFDGDTSTRYHKIKAGPYIQLTVSDTGCGIDPEIKDRIFDPYFTTKEIGKGTGLGLAVVHGIVNNHDGAISVYSEPAIGTTVKVLFPLIDKRPVKKTVLSDELPQGNEKVLYIDDEKSLVKMGQQILKRLGYQVDARTNPIEALDLFRLDPDQFDLIITDMTMPKMNGDQLAKKILDIRKAMPIILCTGFSEKINNEKASEIGIRKYIEKPLDKRKLAFAVREVLDGKD